MLNQPITYLIVCLNSEETTLYQEATNMFDFLSDEERHSLLEAQETLNVTHPFPIWHYTGDETQERVVDRGSGPYVTKCQVSPLVQGGMEINDCFDQMRQAQR